MAQPTLKLAINPGGAAERAGLESGDVLVAYNGESIQTPDALAAATRSTAGQAGQVALQVVRDGVLLDFTAEPGPLGVVVSPCDAVEIVAARERRREAEAIRAVTVTTAPSVEGRAVVQTLDVVSSEYALGLNIFKDILTALTDTFGGRSGTLQKAMRQARADALNDLRAAAHELGGNAVIATRIEYTEFSGQGKSMLLVAAYGTAVVVQA